MATEGRVGEGFKAVRWDRLEQSARSSVDTLAQRLERFRLNHPTQSRGDKKPLRLAGRVSNQKDSDPQLANKKGTSGEVSALVANPSLQIWGMRLLPKGLPRQLEPLARRLTPFEAEFVTPEGDSSLYHTTSKPIEQLGAKWRWCPSDHLPVGLQIEGLNFCSWNVLGSTSIQPWVMEKNTQGLKGSILTSMHVLIQENGIVISQRELEVVRLLLCMLNHSSYPKVAIALQECEPPFLQYLATQLPAHIKLICQVEERGCAMLYDTRVLTLREVTWPAVFSKDPGRVSMDVLFEKIADKKPLRLLNVHVPGDPMTPAKREWMEYVAAKMRGQPLLVCGDMNFEQREMKEAFKIWSKLDFHVPYRTNVGSQGEGLCAKAIDYFMTSKLTRVHPLLPEQIFEESDQKVITNTLALFVSRRVHF